ncbi:MAG: hypothetical protein WCR42_00530 [bacterium]
MIKKRKPQRARTNGITQGGSSVLVGFLSTPQKYKLTHNFLIRFYKKSESTNVNPPPCSCLKSYFGSVIDSL